MLSNTEIQALITGDRHRHRRRVRHRQAALPPGHRHDRRRRGRLAHPHAGADVPVPAHAGALRPRPHLHRRPAALPVQARQPGELPREGGRSSRSCSSASGSPTSRSRDAAATVVKLTPSRSGRVHGLLTEFQGWSARLRSDFGQQAADFVSATGSSKSTPSLRPRPRRRSPSRLRTATTLEPKAGAEALEVRVVEVETNATRNVVVPAELLGSPIYDRCARPTRALAEVVGALPPFTLRDREGLRRGETASSSCATGSIDARQEPGIQLSRFKGLGEMNARRALGDDDGSRPADAGPGRRRGRPRRRPAGSRC